MEIPYFETDVRHGAADSGPLVLERSRFNEHHYTRHGRQFLSLKTTSTTMFSLEVLSDADGVTGKRLRAF